MELDRIHGGEEIGRMIKPSDCPYGWKIRCIQAEEMDAGLSPVSDLGSDVELGKA